VSLHPNCKRQLRKSTKVDAEYIQGTFMEHSWNIQGTFREYDELNLESEEKAEDPLEESEPDCDRSKPSTFAGTFREHSVNIQGTFKEHSG
jgi:hypothetical protein